MLIIDLRDEATEQAREAARAAAEAEGRPLYPVLPVLTLQTHLVFEVHEYEHLIEPFAGVPSIQADWAPLAMTNTEALAVYEASKRAFRAPKELIHMHAKRVRIQPPPTLSQSEAALVEAIGRAHRDIVRRAEAERLHAESVAADKARVESELAESRRQAAEVAEIQTRAESPDAEPAPPAHTDEPKETA